MEERTIDFFGYKVHEEFNFDQCTVVYKTKDYSVFKGLPNNRPIDPKNVSKIVQNMRRFGILINPIVVNEHLQIVDGQHRFEAIKILGGGRSYSWL